jgi:hypothetical protein
MQISVRRLDAVNIVLLGHQYSVSVWFLHGLQELVKRESELSVEDCERLGWHCARNIFVERERCWKFGHRQTSYGMLSATLCQSSHHMDQLKATFMNELSDMAPEEEGSREHDSLQQDASHKVTALSKVAQSGPLGTPSPFSNWQTMPPVVRSVDAAGKKKKKGKK